MKKFLTIALCLGLTAPALLAAKGDAKPTKEQRKAVNELIKSADKNSNNKIDTDEVAALQEGFTKGGDAVKSLDRNANGKLDDKEIEGISKRLENRAKPKGEGKKGKGKGKKKQEA